jgi:hypothetical protein
MIFIPRELAARADALKPQPDYRFSSDGCSSPASWLGWELAGHGPPWEGCCVAHDFAYWRGGTRADRRAADRQLRRCVVAKAQEYAFVGRCLITAVAWIMWVGVRLGGGPYLPVHWRWGYGWRWPTGYD